MHKVLFEHLEKQNLVLKHKYGDDLYPDCSWWEQKKGKQRGEMCGSVPRQRCDGSSEAGWIMKGNRVQGVCQQFCWGD